MPELVDDTTTRKRIARDKERVLAELEINPIPSIAIRKVDISHSTFYRWLKKMILILHEKYHSLLNLDGADLTT